MERPFWLSCLRLLPLISETLFFPYLNMVMRYGDKTLPICLGLHQSNVTRRLPNSFVLWICHSSLCTWISHALELCEVCWNGASQCSCSKLIVLGVSGFCLPVGSPGPAWVSQCCANTLCSFASTVSFQRSDALWLLSPFPTQLLSAYSLLTGNFMYLAMVTALYFPAPLLWLSALIYFSSSQIHCFCHGIGSSLTAKRRKEKNHFINSPISSPADSSSPLTFLLK